MFWPGMGDPTKRKKTLKFLVITAVIAISVGITSSLIQGMVAKDDPLKVCINTRDTPHKITARLEVYIDNQPHEVTARAGFDKEGCQRSLYTLTNDGTIYAEWENEDYQFEIGHFLWVWKFPLRDMDESKSRVWVDGVIAPEFIRAPLIDGATYKAEFISKEYDDIKDKDFLPPGK